MLSAVDDDAICCMSSKIGKKKEIISALASAAKHMLHALSCFYIRSLIK